jgi:hypothetical protein
MLEESSALMRAGKLERLVAPTTLFEVLEYFFIKWTRPKAPL